MLVIDDENCMLYGVKIVYYVAKVVIFLNNHPKRQINPLRNGPLGFGNLVLPMVLGRSGHEQKTTVAEYEVLFDLRRVVAKVKHAFGPKTHRTNHRVCAQFRFVVGVPRHAVRAAPVIVE